MTTTRRTALALVLTGATAGQALGQAANQWFPLTGDDGHPVPNGRIPVELAGEVEDLPGAIWGGSASPAVTLACFYDFNCPWCRAASRDLAGLMAANRDLRVGLVNNPVLSPGSVQAAKVQLALLRLEGAKGAHALYDRLYAGAGPIDGPKALDAAAALGFDRGRAEREADGDDVRNMLRQQTRLAADLGLVATPSYVVGAASILGYPGPKALAKIAAAAQACGSITCA